MASQRWSVARGRPHDGTSSGIQPLSDAAEGGSITLPIFEEEQNISHDKTAECSHDITLRPLSEVGRESTGKEC